MPKLKIPEEIPHRLYILDNATHDVVVEGGGYHGKENEVFHQSFSHNAFPHPPRIALVMRRETLRRGRDMGRFCNNDYYILRVIRGGHGLHVCGDHPYAMVRGDAYIVPPRTIFSFHDFQDIEMDACYFQRRLFRREEWAALREIGGFAKLFVPVSRAAPAKKKFQDQRLHLTPEQCHRVEAEIDEIRSQITDPAAMGAIVARHRFFCLLAMLAKWHDDREEGSGKTVPQPLDRGECMRLAEVIDFCERNFHQPISVAHLAALMFLSPVHFSRLFAQEMGVPPATYLRRLRLEHAQALLRTTRLPVGEVAGACGYLDADVFARAFRANFATTPSKYRKTFRLD